ncbi:unnamed protein product, partial [Prorocentrum cordatum]
DGIRASKYGAHLFHTKYERVWDYVTQFSEWIPFDHRVRGLVPDKDGNKQLVPIPPVQSTVKKLFGEEINTEEDMIAYYDKVRVKPAHGGDPKNSEEAALARVGPDLYDAIFKRGRALYQEAVGQVPRGAGCVRDDALAVQDQHGRALLPRRLAGAAAAGVHADLREHDPEGPGDPNISVRVNCDYFAEKDAGRLPEFGNLIYTGPIDTYPDQGMPKLEYRSIRFEEEFIPEPDAGFFQETLAMVINYPSSDVPFTRIVEYKHVPNQTEAVKEGKVKGTLIAKEFSMADGPEGGGPVLPGPEPREPGAVREVPGPGGEGGGRQGVLRRTDGWPRTSTSTWTRPS